ncbi:MAG: sensor domain-containing diguanylate cyclase [Treponema sp.]|nr:sensor domain-containing diguanylate cyclase [Treponema sp.]
MYQNEGFQKNKSEYEALHNTVIANERLTPLNIIRAIIIIILIIAIMMNNTYFDKKNTIKNAEQVTKQMSEYIASNISQKMGYAKSSIKLSSYNISQAMTSSTLENPADIITPMIANSPFDKIEYIRSDGMNVMNIGEAFDASDRVYYIEGIKGKTGIWNNFHPKNSQETLINFYTPIIYDGEISGVLTGYIAATKQISPLFETKLYGQDIYGLLVDENDMVICSTIKSEYIKDLSLDLFMDNFGLNNEQKTEIHKTINTTDDFALSHKTPGGQGRISLTKIPDTDWKVVIITPEASFDAIVSTNSRNSIIAISLISLILILYAAAILIRNIKRQKEIAEENAKLEKENRTFNEENRKAFNEISAIRDIIASAGMGTWRIELLDDQDSRMYVDNTMKHLMGIEDKVQSPEEIFKQWFNNICPQAKPSIMANLNKMKEGKFDESTYLWKHPIMGERYVRSGGTAQKIQGGFLLGGYHYDVDEVVRQDIAKVQMLEKTLHEKNDYYNTLGSLAEMFNSLHVIDLKEDSVLEVSASKSVREIVNHKNDAAEMMIQAMSSLTIDEYRERALEFTNLKTLADRMQNKKYITNQLIGTNIGWFLASFITMEKDDEGRPTKVIYTTQSIDEEKKQEEKLISKSRTDELTGLLNRRAYEEDIYQQEDFTEKGSFVSVSMDVNGLKVVNDNLGHAAGDELLIGASQCIKESLGPYGKLYRTGGDEFIAILMCDKEQLKKIFANFEKRMAKWKGKLVDSLSISYGFISSDEEPDLSVKELAVIADKRMYEAKSEHYIKTGKDRRGPLDAQKALCQLYTKILKINISEDSYQIINMDMSEQSPEKGFADKLSAWFSSFAKSGLVHPDDLQEYQNKTDLQFLRAYFTDNHADLRIFYRRKYDQDYKQVMMEIIPTKDYSQSNQSLYLYVKQID